MVEAVLFDWGGTLVEFEWDYELLLAGHRAGLAAIGSGADPDEFTHRYRDVVLPRVGVDYGELLRELLGPLPDERVDAFIDAEHEVWRPAQRVLDSAQALLEALRARGLATGVVANAWPEPGRVLRADMERAGLAHLFDTVVLSTDLGLRKPAPQLFERALAELAVEPAHAVYVGDRVDADVHGAADVGMRTIQAMWFRADDPDTLRPPDFTAFTPMDVLNAVRRLA